MDMNLPKQRRTRKKKEAPLDPQAAREEAELRMKIQQSLQHQYVDRANVEDGSSAQPANNSNPLMMYGQMGVCGMTGEQDMGMMMMNGGVNMQQEMLQREMMAQKFQNQSPFNNRHFGMMDLSPGEMAQCVNNAEMKMYEMQLQEKKMLLHQKITELEWQRQQQQQQQTWSPGLQQQRSNGMGINGADIMRELRMKQEQLLQMGAARKHTEEMSRGVSSGSESQLYNRGYSDPSISEDSSFFSGSESDISLARKWYNHQRGVMNKNPQFEDESYARQNSNQSAHSQHSNVVDLTEDSREKMVSPMSQHRVQSPSSHALEMEAILKQKLMLEMQKEAMMKQKMMVEMQRLQSPSPQNAQAMELMMKQKMMQEMQMAQSPSPQNVQAMMQQQQQQQQVLQNQQNNQGSNMQKSPGKSRELLFAMLNRITSEDTNQSGLESLLSMPTPGGGSVRDSLTLGDLETWLAMKNSTGTADMGFHPVNDMSASFNSVMGDSMVNLAGDNIVTPGVEADDGQIQMNSSDLSNRGSCNLGTIAEDGGVQEAGRDSRISLTVNDLEAGRDSRISLTVDDLKPGWSQERNGRMKSPTKQTKAPSIGQTGKKESITVGDLKQNDVSTSTGYSHNSGMSLSLGDFGEDILDAQMSFGSVRMRNSLQSHGTTPISIRNHSNQSEMMMSMDSMTYSALVHENDSISELARDLSDVAEGDNESRASTSTDMCLGPDGKPGSLKASQNSRASSSKSRRSQKRSTASRPSVMSEISQWSNSNPYGEDGEENAQDDNERQKSGESVDVAELENLHDSVDFSLSMMSSMHMSELDPDHLLMSIQGLEVTGRDSDEHND